MTLSKLKLLAIPLGIAAAVATGAAVLADPAQDAQKRTAPAAGSRVADPSQPETVTVEREALDPRLAALSRIEMAREALRDFESDRIYPDSDKINQWSLRLMEAESELARTPEERFKAVEDHRDRLRKWERVAKTIASGRGEPGPRNIMLNWQFHQMQAERMLAAAKKPRSDRFAASEASVSKFVPPSPAAPAFATDASGPEGGVASDASGPPDPFHASAPAAKGGFGTQKASSRAKTQPTQSVGMPGMGMMMGGGGFGGVGGPRAMKSVEDARRVEIAEMLPKVEELDKTPKSQAIHKKLNEPISMSFANETPLEDVLKYIKSATQGPNDTGIPIYVDPVGLAEAEKTLTSPITMDLEGVPLKTTLRLMLKQLGLAYCVKEGVLYISSVNGIFQELEEFESTHPEMKKPETGGIQ
jgi:hypothetical protein